MWYDISFMITTVLALATIFIIFYCNQKQYKQMEKQIKVQTDQIKHNFFSDFTKRYQDIILHFPVDIYDENFSYEGLPDEVREEILRYMRVYFDLSSEQYFLHQKKVIDDQVWDEWKQGMHFTFNKPGFRIAWKKLTDQSNLYDKFKDFINKEILD